MYQDYKNKIIGFYQAKKHMPNYAEIMKLVGFKSKNSVSKLVAKLVDEGVVTKDSKGRLIPNQMFGEVPMLGYVKAGFPSPAEEQLSDRITLDELLIPHKEKTFLLTVDGDSMIDEGIKDGDWVLVEKTEKAKDGQIVIAEVDGEFTMKYYKEKNGKVWLEPANKKFKPIYPEHSLKVAAVVISVIRQY